MLSYSLAFYFAELMLIDFLLCLSGAGRSRSRRGLEAGASMARGIAHGTSATGRKSGEDYLKKSYNLMSWHGDSIVAAD